jgi:hypothetical protein
VSRAPSAIVKQNAFLNIALSMPAIRNILWRQQVLKEEDGLEGA